MSIDIRPINVLIEWYTVLNPSRNIGIRNPKRSEHGCVDFARGDELLGFFRRQTRVQDELGVGEQLLVGIHHVVLSAAFLPYVR